MDDKISSFKRERKSSKEAFNAEMGNEISPFGYESATDVNSSQKKIGHIGGYTANKLDEIFHNILR